MNDILNDNLDFFTYSDDIPDGVGFNQFGIIHFLWLLGIALVTVVLAVLFKNNKKQQNIVLKIIGTFLVFLIILRIAVLFAKGHMSVYELPLHLCSLAGFICFLHAFTGWDFFGHVLYSLCLPGTILALVFPDWSYYPAFNFITFHGFLFHGGIVIYIVLGLISNNIKPSVYKMWKAILFLVIIVPVIFVFDRYFDVNYMFLLRPSLDSPLEWIEVCFGRSGYLIVYALLVMIVVTLMNVIYGAIHGFKRKYYNN
jgi:hypothetical integral membrane protein (TIGR02206 family)